MITQKYAVLQISVADPTHKETSIIITLQGNKKCKMAEALYDKIKDKTFLTIYLPQGPQAGKTVQLMVEGGPD